MGLVEKFARNRVLAQAKKAIETSYKQGRIKFFPDGNDVEYTDKDGKTSVLSYGDFAAILWTKMNDEMGGSVSGASLAILDISPDDIKGIILKLR